ncbi:hypothetical protein FOZ61_005127 [Perkinsus olseni]|uniref:Uncharacterized protein n=1 Tax=Perkinsus olseni TaxID=32597 RepID=A0A7J6LI07_PEROL|nr:hypothetical protein FOZ61_005127 [Perkinsus olseni]
MSSRLMEVRERYKQLRRKASDPDARDSPEPPSVVEHPVPTCWEECKGETSVEELENPLPRHPRLGYVNDENSTDSVSTANILNPPVQAYGKGLGDVAASIEGIGSESLTTNEVLQPPLWFAEYHVENEVTVTSPNVRNLVGGRGPRQSDAVLSASIETVKLSIGPERAQDALVPENEGGPAADRSATNNSNAKRLVQRDAGNAEIEDVSGALLRPTENARSEPIGEAAEINLIDLTVQEEDATEAASHKGSPDTLLLSTNQTLSQSQLSEVSLCNRTFVGNGTLAAEMGKGAAARLPWREPIEGFPPPGGGCHVKSLRPAGSGPELPGVSEMTPVGAANTALCFAHPCGGGTVPERRTTTAERKVQARPQVKTIAVQVEESELIGTTEGEESPLEPSILPEHLRDRLLNQLYKKCCHSPLRLAKLLKELGGEESMPARDGEMLRQSIGVESDVGRRQFCNIVAAMVRRSCDGLSVAHTAATGAGLQICFDEMMIARHRAATASNDGDDCRQEHLRRLSGDMSRGLPLTCIDDATWVSLMRDALGKVTSEDLGHVLLKASGGAMIEQAAIHRKAVTAGVQTRSFRQMVERSQTYTDLSSKYEMKCNRVATLEKQLTKAAGVMAGSRQGASKERELTGRLGAMQKERDKLTEALMRKEKRLSEMEERLDEATERCATLECELSQLRQEKAAADDRMKTPSPPIDAVGRERLGVVVGREPFCTARGSPDSATQRRSNDFVCKLLKAEGWSMGKLPSRAGLLSRQPTPHRRVFKILSTPCGSWQIVWEDPTEKAKRHRMMQIADIVGGRLNGARQTVSGPSGVWRDVTVLSPPSSCQGLVNAPGGSSKQVVETTVSWPAREGRRRDQHRSSLVHLPCPSRGLLPCRTGLGVAKQECL